MISIRGKDRKQSITDLFTKEATKVSMIEHHSNISTSLREWIVAIRDHPSLLPFLITRPYLTCISPIPSGPNPTKIEMAATFSCLVVSNPAVPLCVHAAEER